MTIINLIEKGYFPEELPPPFHTGLLAGKLKKITPLINLKEKDKSKKIFESDSVRYTIPKVGIQRRVNGIPNPYHQILLSREISKNWSKLKAHYKKSKLSISIPDEKKNSKRAIIQLGKFDEFKEKCLRDSFDCYFELKADISKYFPSIYTHSIPWAIHSKSVSKARRTDRTLFGNVIDECVRRSQSGQTKGIVIGTDTSRIIAEIVGTAMDVELLKELSLEKVQIKGYRFVDDYHFFFVSQADAERALKHLQRVLNDYSLNVNDEKTSINKAPFEFESKWNLYLTNFRFRRKDPYQKTDLRNYAGLLIRLAKKYPNDSVIKYGIKIFKKVAPTKSSWPIFESLSFSLALSEGSILPDLCEILLRHKALISRKNLERFLDSFLNQHVYKGNHFEVAWGLWIAKTFKINISHKLGQLIADSGDVISIIILLDLRASKLTSSKISLKKIKQDFNRDGLLNGNWLLVYESIHKGWITDTALKTEPFFEHLSKIGVSFYDNTKQVNVPVKTSTPVVISSSKKKKIKEEYD